MDRDFILGGHIASYFEETDKKKLGKTFTQNAK
jgi:hypothetical protein